MTGLGQGWGPNLLRQGVCRALPREDGGEEAGTSPGGTCCIFRCAGRKQLKAGTVWSQGQHKDWIYNFSLNSSMVVSLCVPQFPQQVANPQLSCG